MHVRNCLQFSGLYHVTGIIRSIHSCVRGNFVIHSISTDIFLGFRLAVKDINTLFSISIPKKSRFRKGKEGGNILTRLQISSLIGFLHPFSVDKGHRFVQSYTQRTLMANWPPFHTSFSPFLPTTIVARLQNVNRGYQVAIAISSAPTL